MIKSLQPTSSQNMFAFILVWLGQVVSLTGSRLTSFALGVWVFQRTGSVTQFTLIALFTVLPHVLISPIAGVSVDRWPRRRVMILSDLGSGVGTLIMIGLLFSGRLEIWHIYLATIVNSILNAFQGPAFSASTTLLVPKQQLGRANGLVQMGRAAARLIAPLLAGALVTTIQVQGVMLIDGVTFLFALATLLLVRFPSHQAAISEQKSSLRRELATGWRYLVNRRGLLALIGFFAVANLLINAVSVLVTPAILTIADAQVLGIVLSTGGVGMLVGSVLMGIWGNPKRRIYLVLGFVATLGMALVVAGLRPFPIFFAIGAFLAYFSLPLFQGNAQAILQSKVAPDVQGRVFALQSMVSMSMMPIAFLAAGPLADRVFEPLMAIGGGLSGSVGSLIGVGPGRGIGLMFILMGLLTMLTAVFGLLYAPLRHIEIELPDEINV